MAWPASDPVVGPDDTPSTEFLKSVTPVPPGPAGSSISGDTFLDVKPGNDVTFEVTAQNDFLEPGIDDVLVEVEIHVLGDGVTLLDVNRVFIIVPRDVDIIDIIDIPD